MSTNRRRYIRFNPEILEVAIIAFQDNKHTEYDDSTFQMEGDLPALIMDESYSGCNLVVINRNKDPGFLKEGTKCTVKAGVLNPMSAEVKWREDVTPDILKIGIEFLE